MDIRCLNQKLKELFSIDLRALAALRVGIALLILIDLGVRATDLSAHYTDTGVVPRTVLALLQPLTQRLLSLHVLGGSVQFEAFLFLIAALSACALLVGWHTRLATVISWLLLLSLQARNPFVLAGGDTLLRMILFWGIFLPLGARYSVDSALRKKPHHAFSIVSIGTMAFLLQIVFVYWFNVLNKSGPEWWPHGTALYYALNIDQDVRPLGILFLHHAAFLLRPFTYAAFALELVGPLLLFAPFLTRQLRLAVVLAFFAFHMGINLLLAAGPLPWINAISLLPFLPKEVWDKLEALARRGIHPFMTPAAIPVIYAQDPFSPSALAPPAADIAKKLGNGIALIVLIYVALWNINGLVPSRALLPADTRWFGEIFAFQQNWNMFAPSPPKDDGWYVTAGKLEDASMVDVLRGTPQVLWEKPKRVASLYKNQRWRVYLKGLSVTRDQTLLSYLGTYLCRDWHHKHPDAPQLSHLAIFFVHEPTPPQGSSPLPPAPELLWEGSCTPSLE